MAIEKLEKPIYINIRLETEMMKQALEHAKLLTGIDTNTGLVKHLIWEIGKPE